MSSQFSFTEQGLAVEHDRQRLFTSNCLKRKFEAAGVNGLASGEDHEMFAEQGYNLQSEKRQRFSDNCTYDHNAHKCTNGHTNYLSSVNNDDNCPSIAPINGNNIGTDSLLQNNLECNTSSECEETVEMDFESETFDPRNCPPNLNVVAGDATVECSGTDSPPTKGSPAREFLRKYRPEYQMHCIPSYCHPGGLWDVMLEVYHGL